MVRFVPGYRETATLENGATVLLRLVEEGDAPLLRAAFEKLSPESRYRRFFAHKTELSDAEVRLFTEHDTRGQFAIGALAGSEGVGVARFIRLAGEPRAAEAAVTIVDAFQGIGLGRLLTSRLLLAAAEWELGHLDFYVLADNPAMSALLRELAPDVEVTRSSGVALRFRVAVGGA